MRDVSIFATRCSPSSWLFASVGLAWLALAGCAEGRTVAGIDVGRRRDAGGVGRSDAPSRGTCEPACMDGFVCDEGVCRLLDDDEDGVGVAVDCDDFDPAIGPTAERTCVGPCGEGRERCELGEWGPCSADCPPLSECNGDGLCDPGETPADCASDCPAPPRCDRDGVCDPGESAADCPSDCPAPPACDGNGRCDPGETTAGCPSDCPPPPMCDRDGRCESGETTAGCPSDCPPPPMCDRDGRCESGETTAGCPSDCPPPPMCDRDGRCESGETTAGCPSDCPPPPMCDRDGRCESGETTAGCPSDCPPPPMCDRDGRCESGETTAGCPSDCPPPPMCDRDGRCESGETAAGCPSDCGSGFSDIAGHPAEPEINGLAMRGAVVGFADGTFRPDAEITRAELAALLAAAFLSSRPAGPISFRDVPSTAWYREAVAKCVAAGFLSGYPDGRFGPDDSVPREQALVALDSGLGWSGGRFSAVSAAFSDAEGASGVSSWARDGVADAYAAGVLGNAALLRYGGGATLLRPRARATRAEVASFVFHAL